jgi:hypothetical protein
LISPGVPSDQAFPHQRGQLAAHPPRRPPRDATPTPDLGLSDHTHARRRRAPRTRRRLRWPQPVPGQETGSSTSPTYRSSSASPRGPPARESPRSCATHPAGRRTLTLDQIDIGVRDPWSPLALKRDAQLELRQVLAGHEVREVRRRADELASNTLHARYSEASSATGSSALAGSPRARRRSRCRIGRDSERPRRRNSGSRVDDRRGCAGFR